MSGTRRRVVGGVLAGAGALALAAGAQAAPIPLSTPYTQSFDTLAASGTANPWVDDVTIPGWYSNRTVYVGNSGSLSNGGLQSFGSTPDDRAIGSIGSGSATEVLYAARFVNDTATTVDSVRVAFTAEQWRSGTSPNTLQFAHRVGGDALGSAGTWTPVGALDFVGPVTAATAGALSPPAAAARSATLSGLAVGPGESLWLRWRDVDDAGSDQGLAVDDLTVTADIPEPADGTITLTETDGGTVVTEGGADDTYTLALDRAPVGGPVRIDIAGDDQVSVSPAFVELTDTTPATVTVAAVDDDIVEGPHTGTVTHTVTAADPGFADDVVPPLVVDVIDDENPCDLPSTPIPAVQGPGNAAAVTGPVSVEGVVVGDYEGGSSPQLRGFYLQDPAGDGDPRTSDGIFVFTGTGADTVDLGDLVRVTGTAGEFQDQTQISGAVQVQECGTGTVTPTTVSLPAPPPVDGVPYLERFEGMLVRFEQRLFVTEHFQLGRFGQVVLSSGDRLPNPTAVADPGADALAVQEANNRNRIILDDASQSQNPDPIVFARGGDPLSASNTLRGGDSVVGLQGVLTYTWAGNAASGNAFRVRPLGSLDGEVPEFEPTNPRPADPPPIDGDVRVAGLNVLNYFNSFVDSECFAGCRGAESALEFERQADKTVATILGLDSDVIALNEIENDGFGPESAIADLVGRLNAETAPGTYAFVSTGGPRIGTDAITVGMLYRPGALTPAGDPAVLDTGAFGPVALTGGGTIQRNRPALAQTFDAVGGGRFTVVANHLKSKGSGCADNAGPIPADPDAGDGQGNCNLTRAQAASELAAWLAGDPTGSGDPDVLITGDLNAYTREDPIRALEDAGYTNLVRAFGGESAYSYVFDGQWGYLDHALASPTLRPQVRGVAEWHVNADEPSVLDYNVNFKSAGQVASLYAPDTFRSSDHDPVVVGIDPADPAVEAGGPYTVAEGGSVDLAAEATGFAGETITYSWDLDGDGAFETPGRTPAFPAAGRDGPSTVELAVRACDETGVCATDGATVAVTDVAPALAPLALSGAEATACRGGTAVSLSLAFTDPGPDGPWTVRVDWGDGTLETVEAAAPGPQAPLTHTYAAGTYEVRVTVSDADGVVSPERTAPVRLLYAASPILSPLAADGSSNVLRRSVIPLFLRVTDCRGRFVPGLAPQVALERIGDGGGRVNVVPLLFLTPTPGTTMSENRLLGLYSYNLGTRGAELGRHRVLVLDVEGRIPTREATFDIVR